MPRDFDQQPTRKRTTRRRRPADFGKFVEDTAPARQPRFTKWSLIGLAGAIAVAFLIVSIFFGTSLVSLFLSIIVGLVLYELWYLTFETSF
jgi:hypothetical protein